MARSCSALARSTGTACQKRAVPGSRYCLFHVERGPLLLGAILGALFSLAVAEVFRLIVPSSESRQLAAARIEITDLRTAMSGLQSEATTLREDVSRYQGQIEQEQHQSAERELQHSSELAKLNEKLDPFIKTALDKYPGLSIDEALRKLRDQIDEVRDLASPPILSYASHRVHHSPRGTILLLSFKRSKDAVLGKLAFRVSLPTGSEARILELGPLGATMSGQTSLSADGKEAVLQYSSPSGDDPGISVLLSARTRVRVEGNNGLKPFTIDVE